MATEVCREFIMVAAVQHDVNTMTSTCSLKSVVSSCWVSWLLLKIRFCKTENQYHLIIEVRFRFEKVTGETVEGDSFSSSKIELLPSLTRGKPIKINVSSFLKCSLPWFAFIFRAWTLCLPLKFFKYTFQWYQLCHSAKLWQVMLDFSHSSTSCCDFLWYYFPLFLFVRL